MRNPIMWTTKLGPLMAGGLALTAATLVATGCGAGPPPNQDAPAGTAVVEDGVTYAVQTSRELNPLVADDRALLGGMSRRRIQKGETALVGVFLEAVNNGSRAHTAFRAPQLVSAEGQVFKPLKLPTGDPFAYRGGRIAAGGQLPGPDSAAAEDAESGSVLVYRVPSSTFVTDRPFVVRFGTTDRAASVQLDL
jgi:hypothetical protein